MERLRYGQDLAQLVQLVHLVQMIQMIELDQLIEQIRNQTLRQNIFIQCQLFLLFVLCCDVARSPSFLWRPGESGLNLFGLEESLN